MVKSKFVTYIFKFDQMQMFLSSPCQQYVSVNIILNKYIKNRETKKENPKSSVHNMKVNQNVTPGSRKIFLSYIVRNLGIWLHTIYS